MAQYSSKISYNSLNQCPGPANTKGTPPVSYSLSAGASRRNLPDSGKIIRRLTVSLFLLTLVMGSACSSTYSDLKITRKLVGRQSLEKIRWYSQNGKQKRLLREGSNVNLNSEGETKLYLDLRRTSGDEDIQLISAIQSGVKARVKLLALPDRSLLFAGEVPLKHVEGYRQQTVVTTKYDEDGQAIVKDKIKRGKRAPYGVTKYSNQSVITIPVSIAPDKLAPKQRAHLFLELVYPEEKGTTNSGAETGALTWKGQEFVDRLSKNPEKPVVINADIPWPHSRIRRSPEIPVSLSGGSGKPATPISAHDKNLFHYAAKTHRGLKIKKAHLKFASGKTDISPKHYPMLDRVVEVLDKFPEYNVLIEGHTDDKGENAKNRRISFRRAESAMNYLLRKGVPVYRIKVIGRGKNIPYSNNKTARGRALNRRVVFFLKRE